MASVISQQRVTRFIQSRFNPIRSLTPEWLAQMIDSFDAGFLREFALAAETIERRDDVLMTVAPKRKKAIGRHGYEVVPLDDSPKAKQHADTLRFFYDNVTATNAIKEDERGGFKLLVKQMADAIGKGYAVHEIIWQPKADGLTAEFRFAPLWFFENRTGKLRYLPIEGAIDGQDLEPDGWLVTVGDGLMVACAIAYMFKSLPLKDWLIYCERFGMPIPIGQTSAAKDSPEWHAMFDAVTSIMAGAAAVKNQGEEITLLETKGTGELPHSLLVERMDRAMTALWRGSDLSTMSGRGAKANTGASVQGEESEILELDDTEWISETLGTQVSRFVIKYAHGEEKPLAYLKVLTTNRQDVQNDVLVDQFLLNAGYPLDASDVAERYGRALPKGKEGITLVPPAPVKDTNNPASRQSASNEADITIPRLFNTVEELQSFFQGPEGVSLLSNALKKKQRNAVSDAAVIPFIAARKQDLAPVAARLSSFLSMTNEADAKAAVVDLRHSLPKFLKEANERPRTAPILAGVMSAEFFNGLAQDERRAA